MKRGPEGILKAVEELGGPEQVFRPFAYYDADGDCIEFFASNEPFWGERIDERVTVYYGQKSGELVGSLIKGVSDLLKKHPGIQIDIECGRVRLSHLLRIRAWSVEDPVLQASYKKLIKAADERQVMADLQTA